MRILRSIVAPSATLVAFCDFKMTGCGGIRSQLICDELVRDKAISSSLRINFSAARLFLLVWTKDKLKDHQRLVVSSANKVLKSVSGAKGDWQTPTTECAGCGPTSETGIGVNDEAG